MDNKKLLFFKETYTLSEEELDEYEAIETKELEKQRELGNKFISFIRKQNND